MSQNLHSPTTVELADGRILTTFTDHYYASFGEGSWGATNEARMNAATLIRIQMDIEIYSSSRSHSDRSR